MSASLLAFFFFLQHPLPPPPPPPKKKKKKKMAWSDNFCTLELFEEPNFYDLVVKALRMTF